MMTEKELDSLPRALVELIPRFDDSYKPVKLVGYTWRVLTCPFCGKEGHGHGGGDALETNVRSFLGPRLSHCMRPVEPAEYLLVENNPAHTDAELLRSSTWRRPRRKS